MVITWNSSYSSILQNKDVLNQHTDVNKAQKIQNWSGSYSWDLFLFICVIVVLGK